MYVIQYQTKEQTGTPDYMEQSTDDTNKAIRGIINILTDPRFKFKGYPIVFKGMKDDGEGNTVITFARVKTKTTEDRTPSQDSIFD